MVSYQYIYIMKDLSKTFPGGKEVLKHIWLSFFPGAKIGVIGPNGAGKSTLMKIMAGLDQDFTGEAFAADGVKVGYLPQEPQLDPNKNVMENIMDGVTQTRDLLKKFDEINMKFADPDADMNALLTEQAELQEKIDACNGWELERTIEIAMDALRCPPAESNVSTLSGGEKRRVALCRLLLSKPDMLLLDEPTNHLDAESVAWLQIFLKNYPGTVVMITHDRYFLDNVTGWILEMDRGEGLPFEGNYTSWLEQKQKRLEQEQNADHNRQKTLKEELEWVRQSPKARQAKSKARITAYEELLKKSQEREKTPDISQIIIPSGPRLGNIVLEAENLTKAFNEKLLFEGLSFKLPAGGIVGIIGPNGAGKTTLLKIITGQEKADSGTFRIGETVKLGYVDQSREALDDNKTVWQEISEGKDILTLGKREVNSRGYVSQFNFKGSDQQKKVGQLSGGERNRVHMAKMLKKGANVLLLDEPTNDLDVDTLRALEEALMDFPGCAVITSHDRWFLDRLATHILAFEGNSQVVFFEGNYAEYEADHKRRLGVDAEQPHRIKYKPISR